MAVSMNLKTVGTRIIVPSSGMTSGLERSIGEEWQSTEGEVSEWIRIYVGKVTISYVHTPCDQCFSDPWLAELSFIIGLCVTPIMDKDSEPGQMTPGTSLNGKWLSYTVAKKKGSIIDQSEKGAHPVWRRKFDVHHGRFMKYLNLTFIQLTP